VSQDNQEQEQEAGMKKNILCLVAVFFFAAAGCYADQPVKIEAKLDNDSAKPGENFRVNARVMNKGSATKTFATYGNSADWATDNKAVEICNTALAQQGPIELGLEPGATREDGLTLVVPNKESTGPVTFKLNFKPLDLWSDPITITIMPEAKPQKVNAKSPVLPPKSSSKAGG